MKEVRWFGDSKVVLSAFPDAVKADLGLQLYRLQEGEMPKMSRPMKSIGRSVFELKEQDSSGWYRVIYTLLVKERIDVLHCFKKQGTKTSRQDLNLAKARFRKIEVVVSEKSKICIL